MMNQLASVLRFGAFFSSFLIIGGLETLIPRRNLTQSKSKRWMTNIALCAFSTVLVYFFMGAIVVTTAIFAKEMGWGIMNSLHFLTPFSMIVTIVILDFSIYVQHILFHKVSLFWQFHKVHHTDLDFDVTTAIRFHPIEIILSLLIKMGIILLIGAHPLGVIIFEIILNASAQLNHANIHLPLWLDQKLRWILVTPDVHRIHHSTIPGETNSNFGFSVTWWDRLCGTFRHQPIQSHTTMQIGLTGYRDFNKLGLWNLLMLPFSRSDRPPQ